MPISNMHHLPRPLTLAALILAAGCAGSGSTDVDPPTHYVRVTGTVTNSLGQPVARLSAQLGPDSGFSFSRKTTDDEGKYSLTSDAIFADSLTPDSTTLQLRFYPTEGRFRDSLLLQVPVRLRVVPVTEPEAPAVRNVELDLP
jgi:hypothetical protein